LIVVVDVQMTDTNHNLQQQVSSLQQSLDAAKQQAAADVRVSCFALGNKLFITLAGNC